MTKADLIYLDMMILSAMCGASAPSVSERDAMAAVRTGIESGLLRQVAGHAHFRELRKYRNMARRACMRNIVQGAQLVVARSIETERYWIKAIRAGAGVEDARQVACARKADAVLLTWDKHLLDLRRSGELGNIMTPAEYIGGTFEGKDKQGP